MNLRSSLALLFSLLLVAAAFASPAVADYHEGEDERGGPDDPPPDHARNDTEDEDEDDAPSNRSEQRSRGGEVRDFHQEQREEREAFLQKQMEERRAFLDELAQDCLNETRWNESHRQRLPEECTERLVDFLEEQREERQEFLEKQREELRQWAEERQEEWRERHGPPDDRPAAERLGRFGSQGDTVSGRYVTFNYSLDPAQVTSLRVSGLPLVDAMSVTGDATDEAEAGFHGARFTLEDDEGELSLHDNPALALRLEPEDGSTFTLDLADYLTLEGNATRWTASDGGNVTMLILLEETPQVDDMGNVLTGHGEVRVLLRSADQRPHLSAATTTQDEIRNAVVNRSVGAELTLVESNGTVADETLIYDDLNISFQEKRNGHVRFVVDGHIPTGRTIVVNVDRNIFQDNDLKFRYYDVKENGTVEVPIRPADDLRDALNPNDDSTPEYYMGKGADGYQVLVTVPHFSAHIVEIQSVLQDAPPSVLAGLLAAVGFLGLAAGNLFKDRRRASR